MAEANGKIDGAPRVPIRVVKTMKPVLGNEISSSVATTTTSSSGVTIQAITNTDVRHVSVAVNGNATASRSSTTNQPNAPNLGKRQQRRRVNVGEQSIQPLPAAKPAPPTASSNKPRHKKSNQLLKETLGESLSQMISRRLASQVYECMICYDPVRVKDQTWACAKCFAVMHLKCIKNWVGHSITAEVDTWRCPGCQHPHQSLPTTYLCFCTKTKNPKPLPRTTPHACDLLCTKSRDCQHFCTEQCHPGPCAPCQENSDPVLCFCGKQCYATLCANKQDDIKSCGGVCEKWLGCGLHLCKDMCHAGNCAPCQVTVTSNCLCNKTSRLFDCGMEIVDYSCEVKCDFAFDCESHDCLLSCHSYTNHERVCPDDPSRISHCHCGKTTLESIDCTRTKCTDSIASCTQTCQKLMPCGHSCKLKCHSGQWYTFFIFPLTVSDQCSELLQILCACNSSSFSLPCPSTSELPTAPKCTIPCIQKLCKKHKCLMPCCTLLPANHTCSQICSKTLKCGTHTCSYTCGHYGPCHSCHEGVIFDDLECACGMTRILGPVACGTRQPACRYPCLRARECGHETGRHECHPDEESCPPCMRECGKSLFENVPCSRTTVPTCGLACTQIVDSCGHRCSRFCHSGECIIEGKSCTQRCGYVRKSCLHLCSQQCHGSNTCSEDMPCTALVKISCDCLNLSKMVQCKRSALNPTHIDLLECQPSCLIVQRNKRMAEALEIDTTLTPFNQSEKIEYSESLVKFAHLNWMFFRNAERTFQEFMTSSLTTHYFPTAKPRFNSSLARYAAHYGLVAEIVDEDRRMKGSVIVRKLQDASPRAPAKLLTEIAHAYTSEMFVQVDTIEKLAKYHGIAVNCILIEDFHLDMTVDDLSNLITPLFGRDTTISLKEKTRIADINESMTDYLLTIASVSGCKINIVETEQLLASVLVKMLSKFVVENGWASDVRMCWMSKNGDVMNESGEVGRVDRMAVPLLLADIEPAATANPFDLLDGEDHVNAEAPRVVMQEDANDGSEISID